MVYTMHIKGIWCPNTYVWYIPCKYKWVCSIPFFYNDIPVIYHVYPLDIHGISLVYHYKKGTEQTHLYFTWYIPYICIRTPYAFDIHGIYIPCIYKSVWDILGYQAYSLYILLCIYLYINQIYYTYTLYISSIFHVYTLYIHGIYFIYVCNIHWI